MPLSPEEQKEFEERGTRARAEFVANWEKWTVVDVAQWFANGTTMEGAGYKRLGMILIEVTGVQRPRASVRLPADFPPI